MAAAIGMHNAAVQVEPLSWSGERKRACHTSGECSVETHRYMKMFVVFNAGTAGVRSSSAKVSLHVPIR